MNKYQLFKRGVFALILVTTIDIVVGRSVYHPLVHLYRLVSWGVCQSSLHKCEYKSPPSELGQGAVSTSHHEATKVGIDVLNEGGNAVDAAVAIGYALAVVHPCCGNLGGGGFMTIHLADGTSKFINFRETAPLASTPQLYQDDEGNVIPNLSTQGYLAVAIPGTVAGLEHAFANYGSRRMERERLIQPAQHLAESGFTLSAAGQRLLKNQANKFKQEPNVFDIFLKQGKPFSEGDRLTQPDLARTLGLIADEGEEVFYKGEVAQKIVTASEENGGILAMEDFSNYRVQESTPLTCDYRGFTVITTPLPGGGPVVCEILNIVEGYPVGQSEYQSAQHLHWMLSAMLFAYRDRNLYFGDPNFSEIPLDTLLSKEYASSLRTQIPENKAVQLNRNIPAITEGQNTTHFSVVDKDGNAVSVTYTINTLFGAGVIASDTGFFLNNEMDDFTAKVGSANSYGLQQGVANQIEPGKRPLSSMAPTVVLDDTGSVYAVTGSPGGATIPTTVVQVLSNLIDFEMPLDQAVNQPRLHYQGQPNVVLVEPAGLPSESFIDLWEYGYRVSPFINWGAAMSIGQSGDQLQAAQDNRRGQGKAMTLPE